MEVNDCEFTCYLRSCCGGCFRIGALGGGLWCCEGVCVEVSSLGFGCLVS